MNDSLAFPSAEAGDPEDVTWTLQTAGTMWSRGDAHEAVRWLRRAAEAAGDAGNDMRAVSLARAAADLTSALSLSSVLPPPVAPSGSPDQTSRMQRPPVSHPENAVITPIEDSERTDTEFTIPNGMSAVDAPKRFPPPPPRNRVSPTPPLPPPRSSPSATPPPPRSRPGAALLSSTVPLSRRSAPPARSASDLPPPSRPSRSAPMAEPPAPVESTPPSDAAASPAPRTSRTSVSPGAALPTVRPRQALRVAVTPSPDDRNLLLVRPLGDDEPLPDGCHEALLTAMEPGAHLLTKKR